MLACMFCCCCLCHFQMEDVRTVCFYDSSGRMECIQVSSGHSCCFRLSVMGVNRQVSTCFRFGWMDGWSTCFVRVDQNCRKGSSYIFRGLPCSKWHLFGYLRWDHCCWCAVLEQSAPPVITGGWLPQLLPVCCLAFLRRRAIEWPEQEHGSWWWWMRTTRLYYFKEETWWWKESKGFFERVGVALSWRLHPQTEVSAFVLLAPKPDGSSIKSAAVSDNGPNSTTQYTAWKRKSEREWKSLWYLLEEYSLVFLSSVRLLLQI